MDRVLHLPSPVILLIGFTIFLLSSCHPVPNPNKEREQEDKGKDTTETPSPVNPRAFVIPLNRFGEQLSSNELDKWTKDIGAALISSTAERRVYSLPTDTLKEMTLYTPGAIYREMTLTVPGHPFFAEQSLYSFLRRLGFKQSDNYTYLWFHQRSGLWMEYYADSLLREDIHYYAGAKLEDFTIPFTQLHQDISRSTIRERLATQGYQYDKSKSDLYKLVFDNPQGEWIRVIITYDKTVEQPMQVQMIPRDRYVLHSPTIRERLEEEGFYTDKDRSHYEAFSYLHDKKQLKVNLMLCEDPAVAKNPGGLIISYHADPNAPVVINQIDFPSFQWGATEAELVEYEKQRGRRAQMFMKVLNVDTDDPNFIHHVYYFDSKGTYNRSETFISRKAVIESKAFAQLMLKAGFDYGGNTNGKIKYFNDHQHIIAIINSNMSPITITYLPLS